MNSTTGTSVIDYLEWVKAELEKKKWGSVSIEFTICGGQITDVRKGSFDNDHFNMRKNIS